MSVLLREVTACAWNVRPHTSARRHAGPARGTTLQRAAAAAGPPAVACRAARRRGRGFAVAQSSAWPQGAGKVWSRLSSPGSQPRTEMLTPKAGTRRARGGHAADALARADPHTEQAQEPCLVRGPGQAPGTLPGHGPSSEVRPRLVRELTTPGGWGGRPSAAPSLRGLAALVTVHSENHRPPGGRAEAPCRGSASRVPGGG